MTDDVVARLRAGLDEDERAARAAIGVRGHETGAVRQHWLWARSEDGVVLTDGSSPVDLQYQYPLEEEPRGLIEDQAWLRTAEEYPSRVDGWMLPDFISQSVTEPTAGGAQHIARHDPARVLAQVEAIRKVIAAYDALPGGTDDGEIRAYETVFAALAVIYPPADETEKP